MRVQPKTTNESQLYRGAEQKQNADPFSDVLARSAKPAESRAASASANSTQVAQTEQFARNKKVDVDHADRETVTASEAKHGLPAKTVSQHTAAKTVDSKSEAAEETRTEHSGEERNGNRSSTDDKAAAQLRNDVTGVAAQIVAPPPAAESGNSLAGSAMDETSAADAHVSAVSQGMLALDGATPANAVHSQAGELKLAPSDDAAGLEALPSETAPGQQSMEPVDGSRAASTPGGKTADQSHAQGQQSTTAQNGTQKNDLSSSQPSPSSSGIPTALDLSALQGVLTTDHTSAKANATSLKEDPKTSGANSGNDDSSAVRTAAFGVAQQGLSAQHMHSDGGASTIALPQHAEARSSISSHTATEVAGQATQTAADAGDSHLETTAGSSGVSAARLIQTMHDSEMRIGVRLNDFGGVTIRTAVSQQQMQTQIAVEHAELGSTLAAHIPSLQQKLTSDFGLHASIEVNAGGSGFAGGGQHTPQQQKSASAPIFAVSQIASPEPATMPAAAVRDSAYRLDIRA